VLLLDVASQVASLLIMTGGFILLLTLARESPSSVKEAGLEQHEAMFLAVGGFAGLLFSIPVLLIGNSLLALNVGGGMVPIFLSIYLLGKRLGRGCVVLYIAVVCGFALTFAYDATYPVYLLGAPPTLSILYSLISIPLSFAVVSMRSDRREGYRVAFSLLAFELVAYVSFYSTSLEPSLGIVSEFPVFLIPMLVPGLLALAAFWGDLVTASAIAYSSASFGVMIGADIVRIPILMSHEGLSGAIGGAGGLDLIYLASLMSLVMVLAYARIARGARAVGLTPYRYHLRTSRNKLKDSILAARSSRYEDSMSLAMEAIDERILAFQVRMGLKGDIFACLYDMELPAQKKYDYWLLHKDFKGKNDRESAVRAIVTSSILVRHVAAEECRKENIASVKDRILAFLIDLAIFLAVFIPIGIYVLSSYRFSVLDLALDIQSPIPSAYILLATSFFIVYTFVFESFWGRTPGKRIVGIKVVRDDGAPISMIESLVRNVVRAVDFLPVGYIIGGASIIYSPNRQRLGDIIGRTVVVRG